MFDIYKDIRYISVMIPYYIATRQMLFEWYSNKYQWPSYVLYYKLNSQLQWLEMLLFSQNKISKYLALILFSTLLLFPSSVFIFNNT